MTMRHTAAVAPQGATVDLRISRSNEVMFEPEEELSVTQEKIKNMQAAFSKAPNSQVGTMPSGGYPASVHNVPIKTGTACQVDGQIVSEECTDLLKPVAVKPQKEKKEKKRKPKLRLEHLPCCIENAQLQDDLEAAEAHIRAQDKKIQDIQANSEEKLGYLAAEITSLKARMSSSLGPESEQVFSLRVELEMVTARSRVETDDLHKQLEAQKVKLAELEATLASAEKQVVESTTKLAENWKSHGQALSTLQQQLADERAMHHREVQQLNAALASNKDQPIRASDQMLANAHQDIVKLEEKVLEVCCENLRADKELQTHQKAQADLVEKCNKLHGPASNLVILFGQPALPELQVRSTNDVSLYVRFLDELGNNLSAINQQLQSRVASK
eukprot:gnl/MRDRNA2_/MRDRNA2_94388_c0_seq1.p1 gnl/MRDRNA2_/MRDRNA2_94388_c0~~gnl/MRDRNA2_/MRDRNA2_94388_c0_seq1.p1  ORF type:complete len:387 (+),score=108.35 gnl/MRDRNA2_/MRDRNA2_94388_c0_seq1:100-1260(+)